MWLETITIRTPELERLEALLPQVLEQLSNEAPDLSISVYRRYPANSDLSLHLSHASPQIQNSDHGLRLAAALSSFGTIDHALWQSVGTANNPEGSPNA